MEFRRKETMPIYTVSGGTKIDSSLNAYCRERVRKELNQFLSQIRFVHIGFSENITKELGERVLCQIAVFSPGDPLLVVKRSSSDPLTAFDTALAKTSISMSRRLHFAAT
jgi:hypothetical protein